MKEKNDPAHDKKGNGKGKPKKNGFGFRLVPAIFFLLVVLTAVIVPTFVGEEDLRTPMTIVAIAFGALSLLAFVCAFAGRKYKWANVISIVLGILLIVYLVGIFSLVGGLKGLESLREPEKEQAPAPQSEKSDTPRTAEVHSAPTPAPSGPSRAEIFARYPVDYENKPTVSQALDGDNAENIMLENEDGDTFEFSQLFVTSYGEDLYLLAETVGVSEEDGGGMILFRIDYDNDLFHIVEDPTIQNTVLNEFNARVAEQHETQTVKRSELKLDLYDTNVDEQTWKEYKRSAPQEELCILAIGAKYRIVHNRVQNLLFALGIILSIALFWPTGGWSLVGYAVFSFLATKAIRYQDTYSQTYGKLNKEYKDFVDGFFVENVGLSVLDGFVMFATYIITIPYQAIMILIGTFAPNFVIAKNGILVSIPQGYDVGNLGAVGAYYASFNFIDEALSNMPEPSAPTEETPSTEEAYTYEDSHGYSQTVYTHGGSDAYDAGGHYVGTVSGEGNGKKFTPAGSDSKKDTK